MPNRNDDRHAEGIGLSPISSAYAVDPTSTITISNSTNVWRTYHSGPRPIPYSRVKEMYPNYSIDFFTIKVCNLRTLSKEQREHLEPYQIIVDCSTPLGNPFHMGRLSNGSIAENTRDDVLRRYHYYFYDVLRAFGKHGRGITGLPKDSLDALTSLSKERANGKYTPSQTGHQFYRWVRYIFWVLAKYGRIELWDWCAPKHCHAETIVSYLLYIYPELYRAHGYYQRVGLSVGESPVETPVRGDEDVPRSDSALAHQISGLGMGIVNPEHATVRAGDEDMEGDPNDEPVEDDNIRIFNDYTGFTE